MRASADNLAIDMYVDLMIRCISNTIYKDQNIGDWMPQEFNEENRRQGLDWPQFAHSMIGNLRLENLAKLTRSVLEEGIEGDLIETGVWRGGACILMKGILNAYGHPTRKLYVADSFEGLPPPNATDFPADAGQTIHLVDFLAVSQEQVAENFKVYGLLDENVIFAKGWFKDTLHKIPSEKFSLVRLDGDLYESTIQGLDALYPRLSVGGYVIVDDYNGWPNCKRAVTDYREKHGITDEIIEIDTIGVYWRKTR